MENENSNEKDKINQPAENESGNDNFPQEYEEQRNDNIRMKPQPLENGKKDK